MGAIVMNEAVVGNNCIVGAGAVVTERTVIPDYSLVIGTPAKVARVLDAKDAQKLRENALHYVEMAKEYKEGL